MAARKSKSLNEKHGPEIEADYRAGRSARAIAPRFEVSGEIILAVLRLRGVPLRTITEIRALQHGLNGVPDAIGLRAIYWGADLPSIADLARRFGMSPDGMRKRLLKSETPIRSLSRQRKIDIAMGRYEAGREFSESDREGAFPAAVACGAFARFQAAGQTRQSRKRNAATRFLQRTRQEVPCAWCGVSVERTPSQIAKTRSHTCHMSHSAQLANHRRWHPNEPRPRIVDRLWELIGAEKDIGKLQRLGAPIGATHAEYVAIAHVWVDQLKIHLKTNPKVEARAGKIELTDEALTLKRLVEWFSEE